MCSGKGRKRGIEKFFLFNWLACGTFRDEPSNEYKALLRPLEAQRTVGLDGLDVAAVSNDLAGVQQVHELVAHVLGEAPALRDDDLLVARELGASSSEGLDGGLLEVVGGSDGVDDVATGDTRAQAVRLAVGTTHTGLETIRTGAGKHLVDTQDVERVSSDSHVEGVLAELLEVLVGADTTSLESLGRDLVVLARQQVDAQREGVDGGLLVAEIEDFDLGLRDTTAEARLDVGFSSDGSVAAGWSCGGMECKEGHIRGKGVVACEKSRKINRVSHSRTARIHDLVVKEIVHNASNLAQVLAYFFPSCKIKETLFLEPKKNESSVFPIHVLFADVIVTCSYSNSSNKIILLINISNSPFHPLSLSKMNAACGTAQCLKLQILGGKK